MTFKIVPKRNFSDGEKVTVSIRMPEELKKALEGLAADRGRTFSDFIQEGLDQWATAHGAVKKIKMKTSK